MRSLFLLKIALGMICVRQDYQMSIYICILTLVRKHLQKLKYFEKDLSPSMVVYNYVNDNHYPHNAAQDPKPYLIVVR